MEVIPGIHQLQLPLLGNPANYVNTYLVQSDAGWVLIDTGWNDPVLFYDLHKQLSDIDVKFEDIERVVYTHIHPDHYGLAGTLKHQFGTQLAIHSNGKDSIESRYINRQSFIQQLGEWHIQHGGANDHYEAVVEMSTDYTDHVVPAFPDESLEDGDVITTTLFDLEVIWTPGHDRDHICLYEPNTRILFSGDHILPDTVPHIGMHVEGKSDNILDYVNSLEKLRELEVDLVLPGHENPFTDFTSRLDELLEYHERINGEVFESTSRDPMTAYTIAPMINWTEDPIRWDGLPPLVQAGLVTKTLAYLNHLVMVNKVKRVDKNGLTVYNSTKVM